MTTQSCGSTKLTDTQTNTQLIPHALQIESRMLQIFGCMCKHEMLLERKRKKQRVKSDGERKRARLANSRWTDEVVTQDRV